MIKNYLELIDIEDIEYIDEYVNMVDISIDIDESFCLSNGIISHNSASATLLAGLSSVGRDYYGILSLKGKILNVKEIPINKIKENEEIKNIVTALGLEFGKKYENTKELRYGKIAFCCDSDADGYHIKGLLLSLFENFWPELLYIDKGFIYDFVSPIVRIEKGKETKYFYKLNDYQKWKDETNTNGYQITYFKGLGTILPEEIKKFFKNLDKYLIKFNYDDYISTKESIDLAFNKKRQDDRKNWLNKYIPGRIVDKFTEKTTYESFFDKEFIQFSMSDNIRSIPNVMDGFKPSQRKIIFTLFKRNYKEKVKVSQLTGAVIEEASYHHGPSSLEKSIVNLSQDFVGSNNINFLLPLGQFGTRVKGGSDSASARYIFTELNNITRYIYLKVDDSILEYLDDDGYPIEPKYYLPIIPTIFLNNISGVGTGWSTDIPSYNPNDLVKYIECKINGKKTSTLTPYYRGFKGDIIWDDENKRYITRGIIEKKNMSTMNITELPIGVWNEKYYDILDKMVDAKIIKDYTKHCTDKEVNITINMTRESLAEMETEGNFIKTFKLESYISLDNINVFDHLGKMMHCDTIYQLLDYFYDIRLGFYSKRKEYILNKLEREKRILLNRINFIKYLLKGELKINGRNKSVVEEDLIKLGIEKFDDTFDYVLNMTIVGLTKEKMEELRDNYKKKVEEVKILTEITIQQMWLNDLSELKLQLKKIK